MSIRSASVMAAVGFMRWFCSDCVVSFDEPVEVESCSLIIFGVGARPEACNC